MNQAQQFLANFNFLLIDEYGISEIAFYDGSKVRCKDPNLINWEEVVDS